MRLPDRAAGLWAMRRKESKRSRPEFTRRPFNSYPHGFDRRAWHNKHLLVRPDLTNLPHKPS